MTVRPPIAKGPGPNLAASRADTVRSSGISRAPVVGFAIVGLNVGLALVSSLIAPHETGEIITNQSFAPPTQGLPFGSDYLGRDVLSRMLHGASITIGMSLSATLAGFVPGLFLGFLAATTRGWRDVVITRTADALISFPPLLLALLLISGLGSSFVLIVLIVGLIHIPRVALVARAFAMNVAVLEFVEAARARGETEVTIMRREIWPNTMRPLAAEFGLRMTFSVLLVSSLSFLGLGLPPPTADWGTMVRENLGGLYSGAPALILPAIAIGLFTIGINVIVDWMSSQSGRQLSAGLR